MSDQNRNSSQNNGNEPIPAKSSMGKWIFWAVIGVIALLVVIFSLSR